MLISCTMDELRKMRGRSLGETERHRITQRDVDRFAELTGDRQWIHTDPERARSTNYGTTIVHGYFTLSLLGRFWGELLEVTDAAMAVNYGLDRVRFVSPVPVGASLYMTGVVTDVVSKGPALQLFADVEVLVEGAERPAVAATSILQFLP